MIVHRFLRPLYVCLLRTAHGLQQEPKGALRQYTLRSKLHGQQAAHAKTRQKSSEGGKAAAIAGGLHLQAARAKAVTCVFILNCALVSGLNAFWSVLAVFETLLRLG